MRIAVSGHHGQVAQSLRTKTWSDSFEIVNFGRPTVDLARPETIARALADIRPDVVVNAAAYTAVDLAESAPDAAFEINVVGAQAVALAASNMGVPVIQLSTDYVFDGKLKRPYLEEDETGPMTAYGRSKLEGEKAVAAANPDHVIIRTSWIFSQFGRNFVRTILDLAKSRNEISVVMDQVGKPTFGGDVSGGILTVAENLIQNPFAKDMRGVFHMANEGEVSWADFAEEIIGCSVNAGGPQADVKRISSEDFAAPASRPANSRLETGKLAAIHGVRLPHWRKALPSCVSDILGHN